jgi:polygalacturonase
MRFYSFCTLAVLFILQYTVIAAQDHNILNYGAKVGVNSTRAIQDALDACTKGGGGTVHVPSGHFTTGTIFLHNNTELHLDPGAVLDGSLDKNDYKAQAMIMIEDVSNASVTGFGLINGNGDNAVFQQSNKDRIQPHCILVKNSKKVKVSGVSFLNSAFWCFRILGAEDVEVNGISIYNHGTTNNDGLDIDGKNIIVSNCLIDTEDDGICFKSDRKEPCENVTVTNCNIGSDCNPIKMGTASFGGFRNIAISNCSIHRSKESSPYHLWTKEVLSSSDTIGISGVALEIVDGGTMDQITISNLTMTDIQTPIFIRLGNRTKDNKGAIRNILISQINAKTDSYLPCSITGYGDHFPENITLRDINIQCSGMGTTEQAKMLVPEDDQHYPENAMFGKWLPAYGLYVRRVRHLSIYNFQVHLLKPDARPAMIFDQVERLTLNQFQADRPVGSQSLIWLNQVSHALFTGYTPSGNQPVASWIKASGKLTNDIKLISNELNGIQKILSLSAEVNPKAFTSLYNY